MYLSRIKLDITNRDTQLALAAPSRFHGNIESSFLGDQTRRLWRIDQFQGDYYLLLLSQNRPDLSRLQKQFGFPDHQGETLEYDRFLEKIEVDSEWNFRLTANPTRSVMSEGSQTERGKVQAQVSEKYVTEWIMRQAEKNGFCIL